MIELIGAAVIGWAIKEVGKERAREARFARYQDTIDQATRILGDGGAPNRKKR